MCHGLCACVCVCVCVCVLCVCVCVYRVFQYHISPQQALYLELSLDPTGTLTLEIDEIIGAIR